MEAGFDLAGVAPLAAWRDLEFSREWVEKGYAGDMHYLENAKRQDPRLLLPAAKSVVCVGLVYNAPNPYSTEVNRPRTTDNGRASETPRAWISRYAWGRDYHEVLRERLEKLRAAIRTLAPSAETRVYVDTGPIVERAFARLSGIGWMGKNTCLINQEKGSWFFLGVILTSLDLEPDLPAPDRCGSCTRCLEACPTGALVEPYVMDASRCIAYFTIELKGSIPEPFREGLGSNVFGCDICQDVCPWNNRTQNAVRFQDPDGPDRSGPAIGEVGSQNPADSPKRVATASLPEFQPLRVEAGTSFDLFNPPLEALASLSKEDFKRIFVRSPIKRTKYRGWLRNLSVAMGNSGDRRFLPRLRELSADPDPVVRDHAVWALARLERGGSHAGQHQQ